MLNLKSSYFKNFRYGLISKATNNRIKNRVNRAVTNAKNKFYEDSFRNNSSNPKKSWDIIKKLTGQNLSRKNIEEILIRGENVKDHETMANSFIEFFTSVAQSLDTDLGPSSSNPLKFIKRNNRSFFLFPLTECECLKLIKKLKNTKTPIDQISVKIFKLISNLVVYPLCKVINLSFTAGIFPQILKLARITPVFKKGSKNEISNYRPISSLHFISKIYERAMANRVTSFFQKYSLFSSSQFGFLKNKSTTDALIHLTDHIYQALNVKNHHISILLDLKKAFDTVNISILAKKLDMYGVRGLPLEWIRSFLTDRESYAFVNSAASEIKTNSLGLPQGSIISPLLFLIYINDLPCVTNKLHCTLFADDTTFSFAHHDSNALTSTLNSELSNVTDWLHSNRLTLNIPKTELLLHSNRRQAFTNQVVLLNGQDIPFSNCSTFLGTIIDENLNFSPHIGHILQKISRNSGILYRIKDQLTTAVRINFYYSFIFPYLTYSVIVWGSTFDTHLKPLVTAQKRVIRTIANAGYRDHTTPLFRQFNLLKFKDIYSYFAVLHTRKNMLSGFYAPHHNLNTRNRNLLNPPFQRLASAQRSIAFAGPQLWNTLPSELKDIENINCFKKNLKTYLVSMYA